MHHGVPTRPNLSFPLWVQRRELRQRLRLGQSDAFYKSLYSCFSPCDSWGGRETSGSGNGLFSLEFSPDGTLLVAGCEENSFLMFDPVSRKLIHTVHNAHEGSVTHVRFLDSQVFATGSFDETVCLWDTRNLKTRYQTLLGHSSMIENIEFSRKDDLIITSAFDGIIYMWDTKNWNKRGEFKYSKQKPHYLLRLRLNPDETKMIISTGSGYHLIVNELDLTRLGQDLDEFELVMFEFAYLHQTSFASSQDMNRFLTPNRRRNRVEMVTDFPSAGDFNEIPALEIHPQGWSAFSRCVSQEGGQEWTCVHDIQEKGPSDEGGSPRGMSEEEQPRCPRQEDAGRANQHPLERINEVSRDASEDDEGTIILGRTSVRYIVRSVDVSRSELPYASFSHEGEAQKRRSGSPADTVVGSDEPSSQALDLSLGRPNSSVAQFNRRGHVSFPRLTHYIEEPSSSEWNISSLGVSADGRLVSSPLNRGVRLLAFSPECSEQSVSWSGTRPTRLYELSTHNCHSHYVLCTKFSPRQCLFVSGCLGGKLTWYEPVV